MVAPRRCHSYQMRLDPESRTEVRAIATELAAIARAGLVLPGSISQRHTRCGQPTCACHSDPPRRHGPYWQWTRKVAAKTVGRWLSPEQARDYQVWVDNGRRVRVLLARLEAISLAAVATDPRWTRPARRSGGPPC